MTGTSEGTCGSGGYSGTSLPGSTATQACAPVRVQCTVNSQCSRARSPAQHREALEPQTAACGVAGGQPAQNCQHWGPALPTAMRSTRRQGWQSRHTAPFTAQGSACALGLDDPALLTHLGSPSLPAHLCLPPAQPHIAVPCTGTSWPSTPALHVPSPAHPISHPARAVHSSGAMFCHCPSLPRLAHLPSNLSALPCPRGLVWHRTAVSRAQAGGEEAERLSVWARESPDPAADQGCTGGPKGSTWRHWPGRRWVALLAFISLAADNTHRATYGKGTVYTECPYKYFQCTFYTQVTETFHSSVQSLEVPAFS